MHHIIDDDARTMADADLPWERFAGKTVLISGASGYVPAYFVHAFMARNALYGAKIRVIALCRNEKRAENRFGEYMGRRDFVLRVQDVRNPIRVQEPIHWLIHAASPASMRDRFAEPVSTFLSNVQGCRNMLELTLSNPVDGFLLVSSVDVYGVMTPENTGRMRESDIGILDFLNPRNCYSCGKRAAEALCSAYVAQHGVPAVIARPFQIIGPGIALDDGRLHADFASQILAGNTIVLKSDGSARRTFIYITDAVDAMLRILTNGLRGAACNVVDEQGEATVKELAEIFAQNIDGRKIEVVFDYEKRASPEVAQALPTVTGASDKLRSLGWTPKVPLKEAVARILAYYTIA